jgi:hypothetical protein
VGEEGFIPLPYLEKTKKWALEMGGKPIDPGHIGTALEVLEEMAARAEGGDLRWLGYAVELFRMLLVEMRGSDEAQAFTPFPAQAGLKTVKVAKVPVAEAPVQGAQSYYVAWVCEYMDKRFEVEYEVDFYPKLNLVHIYPSLRSALRAAQLEELAERLAAPRPALPPPRPRRPDALTAPILPEEGDA